MYCDKRITITLFISLIVTIIVSSSIWIYENFISKLFENFDNKRNIKMKIYKSEIKKHPFPRSVDAIKSLAIIRGSESNYKYAEAFKLIFEKKHIF